MSSKTGLQLPVGPTKEICDRDSDSNNFVVEKRLAVLLEPYI